MPSRCGVTSRCWSTATTGPMKRTWDHHLGILLEQLAELGIADETAVIVSSDHGECLGENGCYGDHPLANEASHHVPMVIRWPGVTTVLPSERLHASGLTYHVDLCPRSANCSASRSHRAGGESFAAAVWRPVRRDATTSS